MTVIGTSLERFTQRILDLDYGDEQERLRYYESYAAMVHLQLIALPAAGALVIAVAGRSATAPVLAMLATAFGAVLFGLFHLRRHQVRTEAIAVSEQNRGYMLAYALSCLTLISAIALRGSGSGFEGGLTMGAVSGLVIGVAALAASARRQRNAEDTSGTEA